MSNEAYIPTYCQALGAEWNCQRLYRLWQATLKMHRVWTSARKLKKQWHRNVAKIALEHAMQQERTLTVWVKKYNPNENWLQGL